MSTARPQSYGPFQFPDRAGLTVPQFERAQRLGLIPGPDLPGDRWSAAVFDGAVARVGAIREAVGEMPDIGATRAEENLATGRRTQPPWPPARGGLA
ncbi:hypothetical protein AB0M58_13350 [Streptomyces bobili]|uniref:hypothetical protein n=1 Tax=Streptomyces bobili TaxID=67280 RepID=UPI003438BA9F